MTSFNKSQYADTPLQYNVNNSHPIIPSSQEYMFYKQYVSVHSEDRDLTKFPNSNEFEIELPKDYLNVCTIKLIQWTFPANYNTFSFTNGNVLFTFQINAPYSDASSNTDLNYQISEALSQNAHVNYEFNIEDGFYNPNQICNELTNKLNYAVTRKIEAYFISQGWTDSLNEFLAQGGYTRFIVVFNTVSLKLWFGNIADGFILTNESTLIASAINDNICSGDRRTVPDASKWGLPGYLGLHRTNTQSTSSVDTAVNTSSLGIYNGLIVPRFYYGDVTPGDDGYWLLPDVDLSGSVVHWVEAYDKINLMGEAFIYMELNGQNCIDETQPFNVSHFTSTTNQTNGIVNSAFAKLPVPTTPISQWFDRDAIPYKYYYPPAERMRRFKIKLRYHNGQLVNFGVFNFSFMLEFTQQQPQMLRQSNSVVYPSTIAMSR